MAYMERDITPVTERAIRTWAIEQVMGALMAGDKASTADIIGAADDLASYVLTGQKTGAAK